MTWTAGDVPEAASTSQSRLLMSLDEQVNNDPQEIGYGIHNSANNASAESQKFPSNVIHGVIYPREICASCDAPLDTNEQLLHIETDNLNIWCTRSRAAGHLPLICDHDGCEIKFSTFWELCVHSIHTRHESLCCGVPICGQQVEWRDGHFRRFHGHMNYACAQCGLVFDCKAYLDNHGSDNMHAAYVCKYPECGSEATRIADLVRHQLVHKANVPRHPCSHCRNYRGSNGFKRRDHLRQHIRNYHRIEDSASNSYSSVFDCRNAACEDEHGGRLAYGNREQLTDHMLQRHGSSPYACELPSCDRVLMNGFDTDKLLKQHLKKDHPSPFQCRHPGCDRVGKKGWMRERDMVKHMKNVHGITE